MERTTLIFIVLLVVLFIGHLYVKEEFYDSSGSTVTVSISDLMKALGSQQRQQGSQWPQGQQPIVIVNTLPRAAAASTGNKDSTSAYLGLKDTILSNVKESVHDNLSGSPLSAAFGGGSASTAQGNLFVQSIPGKSPADDYIRKDSIPCYACSLP